jgi:hypothetical protein
VQRKSIAMRVASEAAVFFYPRHRFFFTQKLFQLAVDFLCTEGNGLTRAEHREAFRLAREMAVLPVRRTGKALRLWLGGLTANCKPNEPEI